MKMANGQRTGLGRGSSILSIVRERGGLLSCCFQSYLIGRWLECFDTLQFNAYLTETGLDVSTVPIFQCWLSLSSMPIYGKSF